MPKLNDGPISMLKLRLPTYDMEMCSAGRRRISCASIGNEEETSSQIPFVWGPWSPGISFLIQPKELF